MSKLPDWHPMTEFDYVQAVKVYPGGRKSLRLTHVVNVVNVDKAVELLEQGSMVYVAEDVLPELLRRWKPFTKGDE